MMPEWVRMLAASFLGTFGFGMLAHAPKRSWIAASLLGAFTFMLYWGLTRLGAGNAFSLYLASVTGSIAALACARRMHMISTVFLMMSIISFVPGLGLYRSMQFLAAGDAAAGADEGIGAMITIAMIVLGHGSGSIFFRAFRRRPGEKASAACQPEREERINR